MSEVRETQLNIFYTENYLVMYEVWETQSFTYCLLFKLKRESTMYSTQDH